MPPARDLRRWSRASVHVAPPGGRLRWWRCASPGDADAASSPLGAPAFSRLRVPGARCPRRAIDCAGAGRAGDCAGALVPAQATPTRHRAASAPSRLESRRSQSASAPSRLESRRSQSAPAASRLESRRSQSAPAPSRLESRRSQSAARRRGGWDSGPDVGSEGCTKPLCLQMSRVWRRYGVGRRAEGRGSAPRPLALGPCWFTYGDVRLR
jgi:hypothetical protein